MEGATSSELQLKVSADEALAAIREALPGEAIVRDEDDAVGRYASDRVVMIVGRGGRRLKFFFAGWRTVKAKSDEPELLLEFDEGSEGTTAKMKLAPAKTRTIASQVMEVVGNMGTVAVAVVAFHLWRGLEVDTVRVALIGGGGGLAWSLVARFWPKSDDGLLERIVRAALDPLT